MAKKVTFLSPVRFDGQRYPAGTVMDLSDEVIKSLPADVLRVEKVAAAQNEDPAAPPAGADKGKASA